MSQKKFISVFTPSRTDPDDLEAIFVQRHALLRDAVERIEESAHTDNKHHLLFVGPRGSGKTHFTTLLVHRLGSIEGLEDKLHIAWLNEDETSTSLLELLLKIYQALAKRYPSQYPEEALDPAFDLKADEAKDYVFQQLLEHLGERTPLIVIENLDALFLSLGDSGQKELRAFLQEHPIFAICATAQALIDDLTQRDGPFFGFFQTEHMKALSLEEAASLLTKIAALNKESEVAAFLQTPRGRARIRALHHLSGGNHRIYVVLSQFITRDNIEDLVAPFQKMVDELTPYYQERVRALPPLQRKIVEYLCHCDETVPVKKIARQLFATHQTISNQLKDLRAKGYLQSVQRGRESLYEVSESLMRICVEVKENQSYQPLRLLVDFIRVWYEDSELKSRRETASHGSQAKQYLDHAYELTLSEGNLRQQILVQEVCTRISDLSDFEKEALAGAPEALSLALDSLLAGETDACLSLLNTLPKLSEAGEFFVRGKIYSSLEKTEEVIADCSAVIDLDGAPVDLVANALLYRGITFSDLGKTDEEIADYSAVIDLDEAPVELVAKALLNRGVSFFTLEKTDEAIADYSAVIDLERAPVELVAKALLNRGLAYSRSHFFKESEDDFLNLSKLESISQKTRVNRGLGLAELRGRQGRWPEALTSLDVSLKESSQTEPRYLGDFEELFLILFEAGLSQVEKNKIVAALIELASEHGALSELGGALTGHLSALKDKDDAALLHLFSIWKESWSNAAANNTGLELPMRIFKIGIDYLKSQPRDESILLTHKSEERNLLRETLGLHSK